jgi:hypothetical protein
MGHAPFTAPDNACTPGSTAHLTVAQACVTKPRPSVPAAVRREVLRRYGVLNWDGSRGEIDHRQPFWSGGRTNVSNLWLESGPPTGNPKDALENYTRRRVCVARTMRLSTVHRIFSTDWRVWWRRYIA